MQWNPTIPSANGGKPLSATSIGAYVLGSDGWSANVLYSPMYSTIAPMVLPLTSGCFNSPIYVHHPESISIDLGNGVTRQIVSFSTHELGEDVVGQNVSYVKSDNNWTTEVPREILFPCPVTYALQNYEANGLRLQNSCFVRAAGKIYAMAECSKQPRATKTHIAYLVRTIDANGLGPIELLGRGGQYIFTYNVCADTEAIIDELALPKNKSFVGVGDIGFGTDYYDGKGSLPLQLCEPQSIELTNGKVMRLWRALGNGTNPAVIYHSEVDTNGVESTPVTTTIPNDPSKLRLLRLSNGMIALAGNFIYGNNRKVIQLALSNDEGQSWFRLWNVWTNNNITPSFRDATKGSDMRGGGQSYPSLLELNGYLYMFCSNRKEHLIGTRMLVSELVA